MARPPGGNSLPVLHRREDLRTGSLQEAAWQLCEAAMQAAERIELDALPGARCRSCCLLTLDIGQVPACSPDIALRHFTTKIALHELSSHLLCS